MIDVSPWAGLTLVEEIVEGNRNQVWRADLNGTVVAIRRSRRRNDSLRWELELLDFLHRHDFTVPTVIRSDDGQLSVDDLVVQRWIHGREPQSTEDWEMVANELVRLHATTRTYLQRPGCCVVTELHHMRRSVDADLDRMDPAASAQVLEVFAEFVGQTTAVVHGDPGASNIRITADGLVGLLDWDESRVDLTAHDLSPLGVAVLPDDALAASQRLSHAWEAANGWTVEPAYARRRLAALSPANWPDDLGTRA